MFPSRAFATTIEVCPIAGARGLLGMGVGLGTPITLTDYLVHAYDCPA